MLRDMQDISREQNQNLAEKFDRNPEQFQEFKETLEAMDVALAEALNAQPETIDLTEHKRALHLYWKMSLNPYDRAMKSLFEKTATDTTLAGSTSYAKD